MGHCCKTKLTLFPLLLSCWLKKLLYESDKFSYGCFVNFVTFEKWNAPRPRSNTKSIMCNNPQACHILDTGDQNKDRTCPRPLKSSPDSCLILFQIVRIWQTNSGVENFLLCWKRREQDLGVSKNCELLLRRR